MESSWSKLNPKEFEHLCYLILEANDFTDIQWFGESGNDKGRDILAKKIESPLPDVRRNSKWVVQSKRYVSKPPRKDDIASFLTSAREHKPDHVLVALTNTLTSNTKDGL
jgi:HJR/Mrr/RecB family endonuclease